MRGPGAGSSLRLALLAAGALYCVLGPRAATAQAVQGTVSDADSRRPLAGASVLLLDTLSAPVDSTTADSAGDYRLAAPGAGMFIVHVAPTGYLASSTTVRLTSDDAVRLDIAMPVISEAAAGVMRQVIDREAAFQLPWEELCDEPVRPWETGVLVGVARDRSSMQPIPRAVIRLERQDTVAGSPRTRVATATGAFWFCNVPPGRVRVTAGAEDQTGGPALFDSWVATIRTGTISWYDALLRPAGTRNPTGPSGVF